MGVALVASAAKGLTRNTCKDKVAMVTNAAAAVAILLYPATWMFPLVIVLGAPATFGLLALTLSNALRIINQLTVGSSSI